MKEIGSEFWEVPLGGKQYLLSGRTALEYILRDVIREHGAKKALLPSYCCHTMIEPFVRHGFDIRFYNVYFDGQAGLSADIPHLLENEIFYAMTYFGFGRLNGLDFEMVQKQATVVIDDRTHSWLSDGWIDADYTFTSFRKWAGFYGIAEATKKAGAFSVTFGASGEDYCTARKNAMYWKAQYIAGELIEKEKFLGLFGSAEERLETDYVGYAPTEDGMRQLMTADFDFIKERRKENADALLAGLQGIPGIVPLFPRREKTDVPLFVPILVPEKRDALQKFLIDHQVYCPVHWPLSDYHTPISERAKDIYGKELSLLCDQRYDGEDMAWIALLIRNFFNEGTKDN